MVESSKVSREVDFAAVFKALGDPNRLAIFDLIRQRCESSPLSIEDPATTVSRLAEGFDLALSTVSHHLKELRGAGLIRCERRGQQIFCVVNGETLRAIEQFGLAGSDISET